MSSELRIEHAKRLLEDKLFKESIEELKQQLIKEWSVTNQHDVDSREQIWLELKLVDRFVGHLTAIFEEGQITKFTSTMREI
jgi:hypothetical protein